VFTTPAEREFVSKFERLELGMTREAVHALLGNPRESSTAFDLSQRVGFEREYARAEASGATLWWFWRVGIDLTYAVGFDPGGKVCMTSSGGT